MRREEEIREEKNSFNEAATHEWRKSDLDRRYFASGPGFNEAATHEWRKYATYAGGAVDDSASMRPPLMSGGNWSRHAYRMYRARASMRPPLMSGGNESGDLVCDRPRRASMRPPLMSGGNWSAIALIYS